MRLRLVAVLLACGVLGTCLAVSADDRKEKEREGRKKRPEVKKPEAKPDDAKPADAKAADPKADVKADKAVSYKTDVVPPCDGA